MDLGLGERGVDPGLVGAERAAALQHEGDAFERKTTSCQHVAWLTRAFMIGDPS